MSDISNFVTGFSQSLQGYLGQQQQNDATMAQESQKEAASAKLEQQKQQTQLSNEKDLAKYKSTLGAPDSIVTPDLAEKMMPGSGDLAESFKASNGRYPTLSEATQLVKGNKTDSKADDHQDSLEKQAVDRLTQVRGDTTLMRIENQRNAAGLAYDTIAKAKAENRPLTELEQNDLVGQLWQARAGKAPTDSDMKLMNDRTGKRGFNALVTYVTGNPSLVGASTNETLANLSQFVKSTGLKADEQWHGTMAPRLIKPTGLDDTRWNHIVTTHRGSTFAEQMQTSDKTYPSNQGQDLEAKRQALRAKLGL